MNPLDNLLKYEIILGSASPRRQELLKDIGVNFKSIVIKDIKEVYPADLKPDYIPEYLAKLKADAYSSLITSNQLVITADTIVICNDKPLGKPKNHEDAALMLRTLSGKTHKVVSGVAIKTTSKEISFSVSTDVCVAPISDDEIEFYIDKFKPFDKAGAYGIQEWIGCIAVKSINGSFYNVMGLPLHRLYQELKNF
ncbi:MAG: Maf-like protein [Muribaculaceae bacterium]|nr:Maf-like protein [Muribaculaceae bacterium]